MKLALLGTDEDVLALLSAAVAAGHELVWLGDVRPRDAALVRSLTPLAPSADWELLLDRNAADAVLVGRGAARLELREEQLKRLVTDAVPLLVVHPTGLSVLSYYELDMVRREVGGILRHFNPMVENPLVDELSRAISTGHQRVGPIRQIGCERHIADCSRDAVLTQLARDVELLAAIAGDIRKATAIGANDADTSFASLQVQMSVATATTLRWSVVPASAGGEGATVTLVGDRGSIRVWFPADAGSPWEKTTVVGQPEEFETIPNNAPQTAINAIASTAPSTWDRATKSMEVVDAVELSLQKGRSIEIHPQQFTERLAFRGVMSALGCGVLMLGLLVLALAGMMGDILKLPLKDYWPIALLVFLAVFLLLQAVPFLAAKRPDRPEE